jgi:hypothetical protein
MLVGGDDIDGMGADYTRRIGSQVEAISLVGRIMDARKNMINSIYRPLQFPSMYSVRATKIQTSVISSSLTLSRRLRKDGVSSPEL